VFLASIFMTVIVLLLPQQRLCCSFRLVALAPELRGIHPILTIAAGVILQLHLDSRLHSSSPSRKLYPIFKRGEQYTIFSSFSGARKIQRLLLCWFGMW
jgi:hypothetical protein